MARNAVAAAAALLLLLAALAPSCTAARGVPIDEKPAAAAAAAAAAARPATAAAPAKGRSLMQAAPVSWEYAYFGTAPACEGECEEGWELVADDGCPEFRCSCHVDGIVRYCHDNVYNLDYGAACVTGTKALCRRRTA